MDCDSQIYPLHEAIIKENLPAFKTLIKVPGINLDQQNENGETPVMLCMKLNRKNHFLHLLLGLRCDVTIADKDLSTPLRVALERWNLNIAILLIACGADIHAAGLNFKQHLHHAIEKKEWRFIIFLMNRGVNLLAILLPKTVFNSLGSEDTNSSRDEDASKVFELDRYLGDLEFRCIGETLFNYSIALPHSRVFRYVWPRLNHVSIAEKRDPPVLNLYFEKCKFEASEFIDCFYLMLNSPVACAFLNTYRNWHFSVGYLCDLFKMFVKRNIEKHHRVKLISYSLQFIEVKFCDIAYAYKLFKFNEEVVFLIKAFLDRGSVMSERLSRKLFKFVVLLEKDSDLSLDKLNSLGLVNKECYLRLLNVLPAEYISGIQCANIRLKIKALSNVPSLTELSLYQSQKHIQQFYTINNISEYPKIVGHLPIPTALEDQLCNRPPIYYNY